jgi:glycosyltransferase involved in cell wall biosynthesis|tara:strand:- start:115 stop:891 length:777 start_codon:yes stop_codon:yes gene_type:complete
MKLSLIIPVYNAGEIINELNSRILKVITDLNLINSFELIFINDSSVDNSWDQIKSLSFKFSYIKGINLSKNFGQHNAIMAGLNNCSGEKIITLDDDLQHPPEFFSNILSQLEDFDACYTYYRKRKHLKWKKIVSQINNIFSSFLLNKPLNIYLSSFRGFKKNIASEVVNFKRPSVYLDGLILKATKKITMITVDHDARLKGHSNYNFKKLLILWSTMVLNFSFYPFRTASLFGIILRFFVKLFIKKNKLQYEILEKTF